MSLIATFYSFKGGVGRSMALANIGVLLAQRGLKTLLVDWDLEAPGLHQYFNGLRRQPSKESGGMLDLLLHAGVERKVSGLPNWREYVSVVHVGQRRSLSLITSGQTESGEKYAARLEKLDWASMFADHDGGAFIESLRSEWRNEFEMTLIDSRTGLTDAGGVCTIQMPDVLVAVFIPNDQNLNGIVDVVAKAQEGRQRLAYDRMPLVVVPLPSRFDSRAEFEESQEWLDKIAKRLAHLYRDWLPKSIEVKEVLELTKIPYVAFFSYGEKLPVLTHGTTDPEGMGYYYDRIANLLEGDFKNLDSVFRGGDQRVGAEDWKAIVRRRDRDQKSRDFLGEPFDHDVYVSYSQGAFARRHDRDLKGWSQTFAEDLRAELAGTIEFEGISMFFDDSERSEENVEPPEQLRRRVGSSALLVILMTPQWLRSRWCRREFEWWCEKHYPDTLGGGGRVYVCRVLPTDAAAWPMPIKDMVGYFCYDRGKDPERARPFRWRGSERDRDDYIDLLVDLSGDMMQRLRAIKAIVDERRRQEEHARKYAAANGQVLFLYGRPNTAAAWEQACEQLQEAGFFVVPDKPVPLATDGGPDPDYRSLVATSDGLLILGTEDGPALDTDIIVIGRSFRNLAVAGRSFLPCAILNVAGELLRTPRRLRNTRNLGVGWIDLTAGDWPVQVRSWLLEASAQVEAIPWQSHGIV